MEGVDDGRAWQLSVQKGAVRSRIAVRTVHVLPLFALPQSHGFAACRQRLRETRSLPLDARGERRKTLRRSGGKTLRAAILHKLRLQSAACDTRRRPYGDPGGVAGRL